MRFWRKPAFLLILLLGAAWGQTRAQGISDSTVVDQILDSMRKQSTRDSGFVKGADTTVANVLMKMEELTILLNKVSNALKRGFDTATLSDELPYYEDVIKLVRSNLDYDFTQYNLRNLYVTRVVLIQIEKKMDNWQESLLRYSKQLIDIENDVVRIARDSSFLKMPQDSTLLNLYLEQILEVSQKWIRTDSIQRITVQKIGILQNRVARAFISVNDLNEEIEYRIQNYRRFIWQKEEAELLKANALQYKTGFWGSIDITMARTLKVFRFYYSLSWPGRITLAVVAVLFLLWLWINQYRIKKAGNAQMLLPLRYTRRSIVASTLVMYLVIAPLIYFSPPAFYVELLWLLLLGATTYLSWPYWTANFRKQWCGVIVLFLLFGLCNVLVQSSFFERWLVFVLNCLAIGLGVLMYKEWSKNKQFFTRFMGLVVGIFIFANALSIGFNFFGRFTVAKFFSNTSVLGVTLAVSLYLLVEIILEGLFLQLEANKGWKITSYMRFDEVKGKFRNYLSFVAKIIWFMAMAWSLNVYYVLVDNLEVFLTTPRRLGDFDFTFQSILVFGVVIWISMFLARLLTYIFGAGEQTITGQRNKVSSWVLLARLVIISVGFVVAIGAAGIPADKLAIVLGALSVGIGFGLQNVVNNLVSGVILAFEKPMQVGDVIELGTRLGTVKEIGIRSSKISTYDGSDIIVPNGDFISQQLVNWTHNNTYRRIELLIGVSYGTDLAIAGQAIQEALESHTDVMKHPPFSILVHEFGDSSVVYRVLFWTNNYDKWIVLKSEVLAKIYDSFRKAGVTIPFPQRDLHIKSVNADASALWNPGEKKSDTSHEG